MKLILVYILSIFYIGSYSQVLNGSFENNAGPDLSNWIWTCTAQSYQKAPIGGGNWSVSVPPGNTQGCFPGFIYQKIPTVTSGQKYLLSGWAYSLTFPYIGIYFGKINKGTITLLAGDTTSSTSWKYLSVQSSFNLSAGDTAIVVLSGGFTGGPEYILQSERYFDLIQLQQVSGTPEEKAGANILIYPNPITTETVITSDYDFQDATLQLVDINGRLINQQDHISGHSFYINRVNLKDGLYIFRIKDGKDLLIQKKIIVY